ncbi:MAG: hypothetical protein CM15mV79_360 [uncultured marine virus]|jgi:hypothetical protein|nr:MAG: hypothetical protein CM15mV79_360 [uncultured marine virus]|tara:strand:- start:655 stop:1074 length:420 start_codon:yes stop_codon:yes gene_type:complete
MSEAHRWIVDRKEKLQFFMDFVTDQFNSGKHYLYYIKPAGRTEKQNNAMHLWFRQMAEQLNDAGFSATHPFNDQIEIPFTEGLVKEMLFKPIIKAMYDKKSTRGLSGREVSEAAEVLVRWLSEHKGIYVPFPQSIKDEL